MDLAGLSMEKEKLSIIWVCGKMISLMAMASACSPTSPTISACGEKAKKKAWENSSVPKAKSKKAAGKAEIFKIKRNFDCILYKFAGCHPTNLIYLVKMTNLYFYSDLNIY